MVSLGLQPTSPQKPETTEMIKPVPVNIGPEPQTDKTLHELIAVKAQLEMMKQMYDDLLKQCIAAKVM